ncbi:MAG: SAM-dependent methyltransferase [Roseburia sp.]|nr:SAM-dependent methyltransferase [Roseburia sp.]MCM1099200.1 SAM-dependent methyltransferase [Ruminococcus flavefaciens]
MNQTFPGYGVQRFGAYREQGGIAAFEGHGMEDYREIFQRTLNEKLIRITLSNTRDASRAEKVKIRPVRLGGSLVFQETLYRGKQVFHTNLEAAPMTDRLQGYLEELFRQAQVVCEEEEITLLISKKGKATVKRRKNAGAEGASTQKDFSHNRIKRYILPEGQPADFLVGLGVQTPDGRVVKAYYDKFRQINRYLEFIEDILDILPGDRTIRIIDFGCGKSYLTFAMYYYLHQLQKRDIRVTGLDLKEDVIRRCGRLAEELGYDRLDFQVGDIMNYTGEEKVDMVVSLHACDKATDYALEKAVRWGAEVILAVPCCQHELNGQIRCETLQPILKYGVIRERMAALITDALRAELLEQQGYDTQILEFIDLEHTPKNLLIRAVKRTGMRPRGKAFSPEEAMRFLHVEPELQRLLGKSFSG